MQWKRMVRERGDRKIKEEMRKENVGKRRVREKERKKKGKRR